MKFKAHRDFLNIYRHQSPFPIYISVLKYNGPICYQYCANTTCAIQYKRILPRLIRQLYRFIRFWLIISIPLVFIYKYLSKQKQNIPIALSSRPEISYPLDKNLEAQLRTWLAQEEKDGYQRLSETIRRALNRTLIKQYVSHFVRTNPIKTLIHMYINLRMICLYIDPICLLSLMSTRALRLYLIRSRLICLFPN